MTYQDYKLTLSLQSAYGTKWQADTIFGHLCWAIVREFGEKELDKFLEYYKEGKPLFLISNGFPKEIDPQKLAIEPPKKISEDYEQALEDFRKERAKKSQPKEIDDRVLFKNTINRITGTTGKGDGSLYDFYEMYQDEVVIYHRVFGDDQKQSETIDFLNKLWEVIENTGFGKRKSIGYGNFKIESFEKFDFGSPAKKEADAFVSLSNFVPAKDDPTDGNWDMFVKYGKLGEEMNYNPTSPFKKPIIFLKAGSTFKYNGDKRDFYGRLVEGVSYYMADKIVQYGFAYPVPIKLS